jgi:hypothetical protein
LLSAWSKDFHRLSQDVRLSLNDLIDKQSLFCIFQFHSKKYYLQKMDCFFIHFQFMHGVSHVPLAEGDAEVSVNSSITTTKIQVLSSSYAKQAKPIEIKFPEMVLSVKSLRIYKEQDKIKLEKYLQKWKEYRGDLTEEILTLLVNEFPRSIPRFSSKSDSSIANALFLTIHDVNLSEVILFSNCCYFLLKSIIIFIIYNFYFIIVILLLL